MNKYNHIVSSTLGSNGADPCRCFPETLSETTRSVSFSRKFSLDWLTDFFSSFRNNFAKIFGKRDLTTFQRPYSFNPNDPDAFKNFVASLSEEDQDSFRQCMLEKTGVVSYFLSSSKWNMNSYFVSRLDPMEKSKRNKSWIL